MNTHALIPLIATIAYIPLLVILLANQPWDRKQKFFFLSLVPAILWSLADIFGRSDFFMEDKLLWVKAVLCVVLWMGVQGHYFLRSFYSTQRIRIPFAYILVVGVVVLAGLDYIPQGIGITPSGIQVIYGYWWLSIVFILLALIGKDIHSLIQKLKLSADILERNQISYLFVATATLIAFIFGSHVPALKEWPVAHIGNLIMACILTYAVIAHHLLDIRVALRRVLKQLGAYGAGIALFVLAFFLTHLAFNLNIDTVALVATLGIGIPVIAFSIHVVSKAWERKIEQAFSGKRYDYRRQLSSFIGQIHSIPTLEQFGSELISLLSQSVDCRRACLLLPKAEDENFTARFTYPPTDDNPMQNLKLRHDSPVMDWLKRENTILPERNLSIFPEFHSIWQVEKENMQSAKVEMFVPLINRGELVAVLAVSDKRDGKLYTVEEIDLLESVSSRVAASMEKEYLYEQLREQDKQLNLINKLTIIITSSVSIQEIFEGFTDVLKEAVALDYAMIALIEEDRFRFLALSSHMKSLRQPGQQIPLKGTTTEWVVEHKKSLYEADLAQHKRFPSAEHYIEMGIHSIVHLPLVTKDDAIGSLIIASCQPNAYTPKDIRLLEQVAWQIATPIENSQLYTKAEQRSRIDELTGLFNRRHFEERLKEEIARHSRQGNVFSLFLLDLDSFKIYNDIYGHSSGDKLLNQIGRIIRNSIRSADQAFRYGGDEFIAILPNTAMDDAYTVAERVREQIASEMEAKDIAVTCSIGLANYPSDGVISGELITTADTALYYAKYTGGNRVYLSSKILSEPAPQAGIDTRASGLSAIYALAAAVDAKDPYTYGHSRKVNTYAVALAEAIGLSPDEVSRVSTAALLHDIGKIGISDKILGKRGKLSPEDWEVVKSHPKLGANIVGNVPNLVPCIGGILYHHERWDGTGYPAGLKGKNIPIEARILAIADAFSAMTSRRPYRDALCDEKVIKEFKQGAGTQFDPELVEVFIGLVEVNFAEKAKIAGPTQ
jgi:diguanylate cyclase (GGDEF)-like protein